jgi:hypothetical protein
MRREELVDLNAFLTAKLAARNGPLTQDNAASLALSTGAGGPAEAVARALTTP